MAQQARWRFTADDYERMGAVGILGEDDRVELIGGEIVAMSPIGGPHLDGVNEFAWLLSNQLGDDVRVSVQNPIRLATDGEPQPDIALLRRDKPKRAVPTAADVLLVVEVADSSIAYDRAVKFPLYAAAGIPEAWLVDLPGARIERHTDPRDGVYTRVVVAGPGETLASAVMPAVVIPVDAVLG